MTGTLSQIFSMERLRSASVSGTIAALREVIANPTANTTLSIALLVAVVIAVLLLVLFVLMLITPSRKKVVKVRRYVVPQTEDGESSAAAAQAAAREAALRRERELQRKPPSEVFLALTGSVAITVLVLLAVVGTYVATSLDAYCAKTCHNSSEMVAKAEESRHTACVSCHEERGLIGVFANVSSRSRMLVAYGLGGSSSAADLAVDSYACMKCHSDVAEKVLTSDSGIRMSHKEVIEAGQHCTVCHREAGHSKDPFSGSMSTCLPCHDAKIAPAKCSTCHTKDIGSVSFASNESKQGLGSGKMVYPAVRAANRRCGACHDQKRQCDYCHGIRMPHSDAFIEGGHARPAAFTSKTRCWRCHDPQWCGNCHHGAFSPDGTRSAHAGDWKQEHKGADWSGGCVCHSGRGSRRGSMCWLCHDSKTHRLLPIRQ